jgi:CRP-like cAMP-binding protein
MSQSTHQDPPDPERAGLRGLLGDPDRVVVLDRGRTVFRRDDPATAVYEVLNGRIRLERIPEDGSVLVLGVLLPGDGLAEASIFGRRYHCDAVAEVSSRLALYERARLLDRLVREPELASRWLARASAEIRRLRALLEVRGIRPLTARVMAWLRLRDEVFSGRPVESRPLRAVADELGVSPEAFYRALAQLESEGLVRRVNGGIERIARES